MLASLLMYYFVLLILSLSPSTRTRVRALSVCCATTQILLRRTPASSSVRMQRRICPYVHHDHACSFAVGNAMSLIMHAVAHAVCLLYLSALLSFLSAILLTSLLRVPLVQALGQLQLTSATSQRIASWLADMA
eukprot:1963339-Pleurochrysis_carterae.AAC.2